MILHSRRTEKTPEAEALAMPSEYVGVSSNEALEAHEKRRANRRLVHLVALVKGSTKVGEAAAAKSGGSPTAALSLMTLTVAVVLLVLAGSITYLLGTVSWSHARPICTLWGEPTSIFRAFVQPAYVCFGLLLASMVLVIKEFIVKNKIMTLFVNAMATLGGIGYITLYTCIGLEILIYLTLQASHVHFVY